jgi:hypothetical protein
LNLLVQTRHDHHEELSTPAFISDDRDSLVH